MDLYNPGKTSIYAGWRTEKGKSLHDYWMNDDDVGNYSILCSNTNTASSVTVAYFTMIHYQCQQWLRFRALAFAVHMMCGWQNCCRWRFEGGGAHSPSTLCNVHESKERTRNHSVHTTLIWGTSSFSFKFSCKTSLKRIAFISIYLRHSFGVLLVFTAFAYPDTVGFSAIRCHDSPTSLQTQCWCTWQSKSSRGVASSSFQHFFVWALSSFCFSLFMMSNVWTSNQILNKQAMNNQTLKIPISSLQLT